MKTNGLGWRGNRVPTRVDPGPDGETGNIRLGTGQ